MNGKENIISSENKPFVSSFPYSAILNLQLAGNRELQAL